MTTRLLAAGTAGGLVLLLAMCVVIVGLTTPVLRDLRTTCAVGMTGTSASITVRGALAGRACRQTLRDNPGNFYELSQPPTQTVICEYQQGRQRFIVRDEGLLKLVGNTACDALRQSGTLPTPAPPTPGVFDRSIGITAATTASGVNNKNEPSTRMSEFTVNTPVYVTYVARNVKQGQTINVKLLRDGQPQSVQGGETTITRDYDTLNGYFRYTPTQRGQYTAQLYLDGAATPSETVTFMVR